MKYTATYEVEVEFEADDDAEAEEIATEIEMSIDTFGCNCDYSNFVVNGYELMSEDEIKWTQEIH